MKAFASLALVALAMLPAIAQVFPSQSGIPGTGSASLRVQVLAADHGFLPTQALVRLRDPQRTYERWETTHDRSETIFYDLYPGAYEIEVSAAGYRSSIMRVDIIGEPVQTSVQVVLLADAGAEVYKPATESGVSAKARKDTERALLDLQLDKLKDAEKRLRRAIKEAPQSAQINYLLGVVLLRAKKAAEAETYFVQAVSLNPRHSQALTALGGLRLEQKDLPGAVEFLQRAVDAAPRQWRPHWLLANARLSQQQFEAARNQAELAIQLSKDSAPYARLVQGEALGALGRDQEAIAALQAFLRQAPTSKDVPAVKQMIAGLQKRQEDSAISEPVSATTRRDIPLAVAPMLALSSPAWQPPGVDAVLPPVAPGVECPLARVVAGAGGRMAEMVDSLDRFTATEVQQHELLDELGKPLSRETRKSEYLVGITQPRPGWWGLQEFRRDLSGLGAFSDHISTRGLLSLALVFHPSMQDSYRFDCEGLGAWNGQPTWLVHFRQLGGPPGRLQTIDIGHNSHAVSLKGRAWIAAASLQVTHIEAEMTNPMPDIDLRSEYEIADYAPVAFKDKKLELWLPRDTEMYLDFRGRRYRFTDHFTDFLLFSVDSRQEVALPTPKK